jgi:hypothetical protein
MKDEKKRVFLHPSSFILHPSSFILHPSSFIFLVCLAIDSVKDQRILNKQSWWLEIPNQAIRWISERIIQAAWQRRQTILRPNVRYYRIVA